MLNETVIPNAYVQHVSYHLFVFNLRAKNFEKSGEYANTWNKNEDGKVNTDGPRITVGDGGGGPAGGFVTRSVFFLSFFIWFLEIKSYVLRWDDNASVP